MRRTVLLGATLVGLLALSMVCTAAEAPLDRVDFGDVDSERAHEFRSEKATIPEASKPPAGVHVAAVRASGGTAPQPTLVKAGEWGTDRIGDWIQYELSERTELDRVSIEWGRNQTFKFDIKVSPDGDTWKKVVDDRSWRKGRGSFETYEFDPVEARYVRIVAHGWTRRWRASNFFINQVRIGQLSYPEAYKPALAYSPGLGQSCRRLMPAGDSWEGGWMDFVVDCKPESQNYLTVKLWGSDARMTYLHLKDGQGRWIYHTPHGRLRGGHNTSWTPLWEFQRNRAGGGFHGRFIYVTYPIPRKLTEGRSEVRLRIQAAGSRIGEPMKVASQGIYDAYTHTDPFSGFAADEPQGEPFEWGPPRPAPEDMTVLEKLKREARKEIEPLMQGKGLGTEDYRGLLALAQAYHAEWSEYYHDEKIVRLVRDAIDDYIVRQAGEGKGPGGLGAGWHRHGNMAQSFVQVADAFEEMGYLKGKFHYAEGPPSSGQTAGRAYVRRRDAYAAFFKKALEWRRGPQPGARRRMANQVISVDRAIYRMNRALQELAPELAMPEQQALDYLYEAAGSEPFFSAWPRHDWVRETAFAGYPFYVVSPKGLTREGGHASHYGEAVSRFARLAWEVGDRKFTDRVRQMAKARATMCRRPANDGGGYAVLRAPHTYSWRGRYYPGYVIYTQSPFIQAAVLQDPVSLRIAELYLEHNRVFHEETPRINQVVQRVEAYKTVKELLPADYRLPMEPDSGDFAWAEEDLAVFAAKHGDRMINGSFFLDKQGVTPIGRIHYTTPRIDRIATIKVETKVKESGEFYTLPDELPGGRTSVLGGKKRPIAAAPPGLIEDIDQAGNEQWASGDERSAMADFYRARFGDYLVAMNTTMKGSYRERTFEVEVPSGRGEARDLVSGKMVDLTEPVTLGPRSTIVLYLGE